MNPKIARKIVLFSICSLSFIGSAMPQQNNDAPVAGTVTLGVAVEQLDIVAMGWRASKLLHANVYNETNEKIGKIGDLIVAPDGSLSVAIVDVGGFLKMGTHHVAVPVQHFSQVTPKIILPGATKDALKQLPEFKYNKSKS
jgi:sporulation protein YlmC with PRC-barrel domain